MAEGSAAAAREGDVVLRPDGRHGLFPRAPRRARCLGPIWAPGLAGARPPGEVERAARRRRPPRGGAPPGGPAQGSRGRWWSASAPAFVEAGAESGGEEVAARLSFDLPSGSYATALLDRLADACLDPGGAG